MTREIAEMWADILSTQTKGPRPGAPYWSVAAHNFSRGPVLLDTAKECFDWAVSEAIDRAVDNRLRAIEERLP